MAIVMRHGWRAFGELVPPVRHGARERSRRVSAVFRPVCAVYLTAQRPHALMVGRIEEPHALRGIPDSAQTAGSRRETGMIGTADRDAAVLFNKRDRHQAPRVQHAD